MTARQNTQRKFEENYRKLEALSEDLQENRVALDDLVPRMKDALEAMRVCRAVLQETKVQLGEMSKEFKALQQMSDESGRDADEESSSGD